MVLALLSMYKPLKKSTTLNDILINGSQDMGIKLSNKQCEQLLLLLDLLTKWNKVYNLSAIKNQQEMVVRHILDSLSVLPYINDTRLLDVGSGAGFPGLVIAIMKPELKINLLDAVGKKCRFIQMAITQLCLQNAQVIHHRVENYQTQYCFGQITSRAFASVDKILQLTQGLLCHNGRYLLMKSANFLQEENLPKLYAKYELFVPELNDKHYLLILPKNSYA